MCVIAFSAKGVDAPSEVMIKEMFAANPDGAGFAYNGRGGKVYFEKGFMCVEDLLNRLKPLSQWKNTNLAIHFRIGTAGKNDAHTCHPFPISTEFGELRKTSGEGPVLFHNGVLDTGGGLDPLSSDTQDFVAAFAPMLAKYSKSKVRDAWIEDIVTGSRLLIMYKDNKVKMYGDWKNDGDILVSNLTYQYKRYSSYNYGAYSSTQQATTPTTTTTISTISNGKKVEGSEYAYNNYDDDYYFNDDGSIDWSAYDEWWAERQMKSALDEKLAAKASESTVDDELHEAVQLWNDLIAEEFLWVTESELKLLIKTADDRHKQTLFKNGARYAFSEQQMCVWAED